MVKVKMFKDRTVESYTEEEMKDFLQTGESIDALKAQFCT